MPNNTNTGSKKTYTVDDIVNLNQQAYDAVDEQAILDKYNQATAAQFAAQQNQNMIAENNFYNQMYNTQRTAMDTIRQSNANAVSTGASRGMQAANELSALLGLQQESIASATELANARRQTAQEETAAMLQNIVQASQDAANQRQQAMESMIQARSLAASEGQLDRANKDALQTALKEGPEAYRLELTEQGLIGKDGVYSTAPSTEGYASFETTLGNIHTANWQTYHAYVNDDKNAVNRTIDNWARLTQLAADDYGITDTDIQQYGPKNSEGQPLYNTVSEYITAQKNKMPKAPNGGYSATTASYASGDVAEATRRTLLGIYYSKIQ